MQKSRLISVQQKEGRHTTFYSPHSSSDQIFSICLHLRYLARNKSRIQSCAEAQTKEEKEISIMCHRFGKGTGVPGGAGNTEFKSLAVVSSNKLEASALSALTLNQPGSGRQCWTPWVPLMENMVCGRPTFASFCSTFSSCPPAVQTMPCASPTVQEPYRAIQISGGVPPPLQYCRMTEKWGEHIFMKT